jgi:carboxyl-terminal processing protease
MKKRSYYLALAILALFPSCDIMLLQDSPNDNAVSNFEVLWGEFDAKYGLFQTKNINWDSIYSIYRPRLDETSSNEEFYSVVVEIFDLLNDSHVALVPSNPKFPFYVSGILGSKDTIDDFSLNVVKTNYLNDQGFEDVIFTYGLLENNIGYIYIQRFGINARDLKKPLDNILDKLKETKGIVIDVRGGYGGADLAGQYIASRFTKKSIPYMKTRVKSGPGKDNFTDYEVWNINPEGANPYINQIVILTNRFTVSARETFCLAMKVLPQVTFVGDTTTGAFSDQINRELPNGWGYALSIGEWIDANGVTYEGAGIPPDVVIQNEKQDVLDGIDDALEEAIAMLK